MRRATFWGARNRKIDMRTRRFLEVLLLGVLLTTGCAEGRFYPVQGPFSTESPAPVLTAKMDGGFRSGNISVVLATGEKAIGHWKWTQTETASSRNPSDNGSSGSGTENMASVWDAVYGQGFYVSHVLGSKPFSRAELTGNRGTTLQVEMYRPVGESGDAPENFKGVARDDKGNIYKVIF